MRILALDQFGELGGAQQCLFDLIPALRRRQWEVHVAAPDGPLAARCRELGATFSAIRCGPYSRGKKTPRDILRFAFELQGLRGEIAELVERFRADLLYVNGPRLLPAAVWASRGRRPLLFHCHSFLGIPSGAWSTGISLWRSRARVVASCQFVAQPLARWCAHPPTIVYNGVPASRFTKLFVWQGKYFDDCGIMTNKMFHVRFIKGEIQQGESWIDGRPSIVIDYSKTSLIFRPYRDELRDVSPGIYLGAMYKRDGCNPKLVTYFAIDARCGNCRK